MEPLGKKQGKHQYHQIVLYGLGDLGNGSALLLESDCPHALITLAYLSGFKLQDGLGYMSMDNM